MIPLRRHRPVVLAVASGGEPCVETLGLSTAFRETEAHFPKTDCSAAERVADHTGAEFRGAVI